MKAVGRLSRSSLALSVITGQAFRISNVRAGRKKPGLKRQHVTCVNAAATICDGTSNGASIESSELTFAPGPVKSGEFVFKIGTAGSTTLVAQTVIPALIVAPGPSSLVIEGGTHNPMAPCYEFLERTYLPLLQKMGPRLESKLESYGFYPAGGGRFSLQIDPSEGFNGMELMTRGSQIPKVDVIGIDSKLPEKIAEREISEFIRKLNFQKTEHHVIEIDRPFGPGNAIVASLAYPNVNEVFFELGSRGVPSEAVARKLVRQVKQYLKFDDVPVGEHLADQLMLPMGIAALQGKSSQFLTVPLTEHSRTHKRILEMFLPIKIDFQEQENGSFLVSVSHKKVKRSIFVSHFASEKIPTPVGHNLFSNA